jgi:DNA-binding CsgD family transcriptional regulator
MRTPSAASLFSFLNALPSSSRLITWTVELRQGLQMLFDDIDDLSVAINGSYGNTPAPIAGTGLWVLHSDDGDRSGALFVGDERDVSIDDWVRQAQVPVEEYHPPIVLEFHADASIVGCLLLWRRRESTPISKETIATIEAMAPLFTFLFRDQLIRWRDSNRIGDPFRAIVDTVGRDASLSRQEYRVLLQRLLGQSYKEIADSLSIALSTVKQHLASAYRKAGVRSQGELIARYFAPYLQQVDESADERAARN